MAKDKKTIQQCRACRYSFNMNGKPACQYILVEGKRRGCNQENCTRFIRGPKLMPVYPLDWE